MPVEVVGRERELGSSSAFLDELELGSAALVIEGEAGIGKTTLWRCALDAAETRGYRVLQSRPAESEAELSYAALADLVGAAFDETRALLPPQPEHALAAAVLRTEVDVPANAQTTAVALVGVLTALADEGPVLVAVDDAQWLDSASERALRFAARRLPPRVGLLLCRRVEGEGEAPLGLDQALPLGRVARLVPGPLSLATLHQLIKSRLGWSLPRRLLTRLAAISGGNPFFALEIARGLAHNHRDGVLGDTLPVPANVHELIAGRVRGLSAAAQEAILVAAVLSRPTVATVG
ncbi:MAG: AAA family ATPase, partial [bacterium]